MEASKELKLMGTTIQLWVESDQADELISEASDRLRDYEQRFSANSEHSQLMKISHFSGISPVRVDEDLFELIELGKNYSLVKGGYLNITIGPLIRAWRIGFADAHQPSQMQIDQALCLIDPRKIQLNKAKRTVFLEKKGMSLDLGAIAKGYFADKIIAFFKQAGASAGLIDLGGNVLVFGECPTHEDGYWRVGIQNPMLPRGNYVDIVKIKNQSVVTSGIYERKLELNGQHYHHIFDSQTGYPLQTDLASLTIISPQSVMAEVWTTQLFGHLASQIIQYSNQHELASMVITKNQEMAMSKLFLQSKS